MAIKQYNPTTPARRGMTSQDLSDITTRKPLKSLTKSKSKMPVVITLVALLFVTAVVESSVTIV